MIVRKLSPILLLFLLIWIQPATAHEEAVLKSSQTSIAAGSALPLVGSDFDEGEAYKLRLVGALREYDLTTVTADAEGRLAIDLEIAPDVRPGVYKIVAIAADGDEVASLDMTVTEPRPRRVDEVEHEVAGADTEHAGVGNTGARAGDMPIQRSRSGVEWGLIGLIVGLSGGLGISLVRRA